MSTLYELTNEYLALLDMADDPDISPETWADTLEGLSGEIEVRADGYAKVIRELTARAEALKKEEDRLSKTRRAVEKTIERLRESLKESMVATGKLKFTTEFFGFQVKKNPPSLKIDDHKRIPEKYLIPQPPKVDNASIKKDVLGGAKYDWCHLEQGTTVNIK